MATNASSRADALVHEIGQAVIADTRYAGRPWQGISIVAIVDQGTTQVSGFSWDASGKPTPGTPDDDGIDEKFVQLRDAMVADGKPPWKSALLQVRRPDLRMSIDFEYDDPLRWKVTPSNRERMVAALRPS